MAIDVRRSAVLSEESPPVHRFRLDRWWGLFPSRMGEVCWVLLNPSTADDTEDDPTIRRCIAFTRSFGYESMTVVNRSSFRSKSPAHLRKAGWSHPDNRGHVEAAMQEARVVVFAWGATDPGTEVLAPLDLVALCPSRIHPQCLGFTADGSPRHPLHLPANTGLVNWEMS